MVATLQKQPRASLKVKVSRKQGDFLASPAKYTLFCAGVGAGKTKAGSMWSAREMLSHPGLGFIGANTYRQLVQVTLRAFTATLNEWGVSYVFGRRPPARWGKSPFQCHDGILSAYAGGRMCQVVCNQLGTFDYLRGHELRWFWADETRDTKREAFEMLMGRHRGGPPDAPRRAIITTTPNGFSWLYDSFVSNGEAALTDRKVVYATSRDNPWLPPGYVESLLANYSARLAKQEVGGEFVSLSVGQAFAEFSRDAHVSDSVVYDPTLDLIHTWDFNVAPLCSDVIQAKPGDVRVIDEIHIADSARTLDMAEEFVRRYKPIHRGRVLVYGDSSGHSRSTRGTQSDFDQIMEVYRRAFGDRAILKVGYSSPGVFGSVQDVNCMLRNSLGKVRLRFSPKCEFLIRDMEQVTFVPGTKEIDKGQKNKDLTHHSDALRYYISQEHPFSSKKASGITPAGW